MFIKVKQWRALTADEKFGLLLIKSNLYVLGEQVMKAQKNNPQDQKWA